MTEEYNRLLKPEINNIFYNYRLPVPNHDLIDKLRCSPSSLTDSETETDNCSLKQDLIGQNWMNTKIPTNDIIKNRYDYLTKDMQQKISSINNKNTKDILDSFISNQDNESENISNLKQYLNSGSQHFISTLTNISTLISNFNNDDQMKTSGKIYKINQESGNQGQIFKISVQKGGLYNFKINKGTNDIIKIHVIKNSDLKDSGNELNNLQTDSLQNNFINKILLDLYTYDKKRFTINGNDMWGYLNNCNDNNILTSLLSFVPNSLISPSPPFILSPEESLKCNRLDNENRDNLCNNGIGTRKSYYNEKVDSLTDDINNNLKECLDDIKQYMSYTSSHQHSDINCKNLNITHSEHENINKYNKKLQNFQDKSKMGGDNMKNVINYTKIGCSGGGKTTMDPNKWTDNETLDAAGAGAGAAVVVAVALSSNPVGLVVLGIAAVVATVAVLGTLTYENAESGTCIQDEEVNYEKIGKWIDTVYDDENGDLWYRAWGQTNNSHRFYDYEERHANNSKCGTKEYEGSEKYCYPILIDKENIKKIDENFKIESKIELDGTHKSLSFKPELYSNDGLIYDSIGDGDDNDIKKLTYPNTSIQKFYALLISTRDENGNLKPQYRGKKGFKNFLKLMCLYRNIKKNDINSYMLDGGEGGDDIDFINFNNLSDRLNGFSESSDDVEKTQYEERLDREQGFLIKKSDLSNLIKTDMTTTTQDNIINLLGIKNKDVKNNSSFDIDQISTKYADFTDDDKYPPNQVNFSPVNSLLNWAHFNGDHYENSYDSDIHTGYFCSISKLTPLVQNGENAANAIRSIQCDFNCVKAMVNFYTGFGDKDYYDWASKFNGESSPELANDDFGDYLEYLGWGTLKNMTSKKATAEDIKNASTSGLYAKIWADIWQSENLIPKLQLFTKLRINGLQKMRTSCNKSIENEIKYYDKDLSDSNLCNSSCDAKLIDSYFEDGNTNTKNTPFDYGIKKLTDYFGKKSKIYSEQISNFSLKQEVIDNSLEFKYDKNKIDLYDLNEYILNIKKSLKNEFENDEIDSTDNISTNFYKFLVFINKVIYSVDNDYFSKLKDIQSLNANLPTQSLIKKLVLYRFTKYFLIKHLTSKLKNDSFNFNNNNSADNFNYIEDDLFNEMNIYLLEPPGDNQEFTQLQKEPGDVSRKFLDMTKFMCFELEVTPPPWPDDPATDISKNKMENVKISKLKILGLPFMSSYLYNKPDQINTMESLKSMFPDFNDSTGIKLKYGYNDDIKVENLLKDSSINKKCLANFSNGINGIGTNQSNFVSQSTNLFINIFNNVLTMKNHCKMSKEFLNKTMTTNNTEEKSFMDKLKDQYNYNNNAADTFDANNLSELNQSDKTLNQKKMNIIGQDAEGVWLRSYPNFNENDPGPETEYQSCTSLPGYYNNNGTINTDIMNMCPYGVKEKKIKTNNYVYSGPYLNNNFDINSDNNFYKERVISTESNHIPLSSPKTADFENLVDHFKMRGQKLLDELNDEPSPNEGFTNYERLTCNKTIQKNNLNINIGNINHNSIKFNFTVDDGLYMNKINFKAIFNRFKTYSDLLGIPGAGGDGTGAPSGLYLKDSFDSLFLKLKEILGLVNLIYIIKHFKNGDGADDVFFNSISNINNKDNTSQYLINLLTNSSETSPSNDDLNEASLSDYLKFFYKYLVIVKFDKSDIYIPNNLNEDTSPNDLLNDIQSGSPFKLDKSNINFQISTNVIKQKCKSRPSSIQELTDMKTCFTKNEVVNILKKIDVNFDLINQKGEIILNNKDNNVIIYIYKSSEQQTSEQTSEQTSDEFSSYLKIIIKIIYSSNIPDDPKEQSYIFYKKILDYNPNLSLNKKVYDIFTFNKEDSPSPIYKVEYNNKYFFKKYNKNIEIDKDFILFTEKELGSINNFQENNDDTGFYYKSQKEKFYIPDGEIELNFTFKNENNNICIPSPICNIEIGNKTLIDRLEDQTIMHNCDDDCERIKNECCIGKNNIMTENNKITCEGYENYNGIEGFDNDDKNELHNQKWRWHPCNWMNLMGDLDSMENDFIPPIMRSGVNIDILNNLSNNSCIDDDYFEDKNLNGYNTFLKDKITDDCSPAPTSSFDCKGIFDTIKYSEEGETLSVPEIGNQIGGHNNAINFCKNSDKCIYINDPLDEKNADKKPGLFDYSESKKKKEFNDKRSIYGEIKNPGSIAKGLSDQGFATYQVPFEYVDSLKEISNYNHPSPLNYLASQGEENQPLKFEKFGGAQSEHSGDKTIKKMNQLLNSHDNILKFIIYDNIGQRITQRDSLRLLREIDNQEIDNQETSDKVNNIIENNIPSPFNNIRDIKQYNKNNQELFDRFDGNNNNFISVNEISKQTPNYPYKPNPSPADVYANPNPYPTPPLYKLMLITQYDKDGDQILDFDEFVKAKDGSDPSSKPKNIDDKSKIEDYLFYATDGEYSCLSQEVEDRYQNDIRHFCYSKNVYDYISEIEYDKISVEFINNKVNNYSDKDFDIFCDFINSSNYDNSASEINLKGTPINKLLIQLFDSTNSSDINNGPFSKTNFESYGFNNSSDKQYEIFLANDDSNNSVVLEQDYKIKTSIKTLEEYLENSYNVGGGNQNICCSQFEKRSKTEENDNPKYYNLDKIKLLNKDSNEYNNFCDRFCTRFAINDIVSDVDNEYSFYINNNKVVSSNSNSNEGFNIFINLEFSGQTKLQDLCSYKIQDQNVRVTCDELNQHKQWNGVTRSIDGYAKIYVNGGGCYNFFTIGEDAERNDQIFDCPFTYGGDDDEMTGRPGVGGTCPPISFDPNKWKLTRGVQSTDQFGAAWIGYDINPTDYCKTLHYPAPKFTNSVGSNGDPLPVTTEKKTIVKKQLISEMRIEKKQNNEYKDFISIYMYDIFSNSEEIELYRYDIYLNIIFEEKEDDGINKIIYPIYKFNDFKKLIYIVKTKIQNSTNVMNQNILFSNNDELNKMVDSIEKEKRYCTGNIPPERSDTCRAVRPRPLQTEGSIYDTLILKKSQNSIPEYLISSTCKGTQKIFNGQKCNDVYDLKNGFYNKTHKNYEENDEKKSIKDKSNSNFRLGDHWCGKDDKYDYFGSARAINEITSYLTSPPPVSSEGKGTDSEGYPLNKLFQEISTKNDANIPFSAAGANQTYKDMLFQPINENFEKPIGLLGSNTYKGGSRNYGGGTCDYNADATENYYISKPLPILDTRVDNYEYSANLELNTSPSPINTINDKGKTKINYDVNPNTINGNNNEIGVKENGFINQNKYPIKSNMNGSLEITALGDIYSTKICIKFNDVNSSFIIYNNIKYSCTIGLGKLEEYIIEAYIKIFFDNYSKFANSHKDQFSAGLRQKYHSKLWRDANPTPERPPKIMEVCNVVCTNLSNKELIYLNSWKERYKYNISKQELISNFSEWSSPNRIFNLDSIDSEDIEKYSMPFSLSNYLINGNIQNIIEPPTVSGQSVTSVTQDKLIEYLSNEKLHTYNSIKSEPLFEKVYPSISPQNSEANSAIDDAINQGDIANNQNRFGSESNENDFVYKEVDRNLLYGQISITHLNNDNLKEKDDEWEKVALMDALRNDAANSIKSCLSGYTDEELNEKMTLFNNQWNVAKNLSSEMNQELDTKYYDYYGSYNDNHKCTIPPTGICNYNYLGADVSARLARKGATSMARMLGQNMDIEQETCIILNHECPINNISDPQNYLNQFFNYRPNTFYTLPDFSQGLEKQLGSIVGNTQGDYAPENNVSLKGEYSNLNINNFSNGIDETFIRNMYYYIKNNLEGDIYQTNLNRLIERMNFSDASPTECQQLCDLSVKKYTGVINPWPSSAPESRTDDSGEPMSRAGRSCMESSTILTPTSASPRYDKTEADLTGESCIDYDIFSDYIPNRIDKCLRSSATPSVPPDSIGDAQVKSKRVLVANNKSDNEDFLQKINNKINVIQEIFNSENLFYDKTNKKIKSNFDGGIELYEDNNEPFVNIINSNQSNLFYGINFNSMRFYHEETGNLKNDQYSNYFANFNSINKNEEFTEDVLKELYKKNYENNGEKLKECRKTWCENNQTADGGSTDSLRADGAREWRCPGGGGGAIVGVAMEDHAAAAIIKSKTCNTDVDSPNDGTACNLSHCFSKKEYEEIAYPINQEILNENFYNNLKYNNIIENFIKKNTNKDDMLPPPGPVKAYIFGSQRGGNIGYLEFTNIMLGFLGINNDKIVQKNPSYDPYSSRYGVASYTGTRDINFMTKYKLACKYVELLNAYIFKKKLQDDLLFDSLESRQMLEEYLIHEMCFQKNTIDNNNYKIRLGDTSNFYRCSVKNLCKESEHYNNKCFNEPSGRMRQDGGLNFDWGTYRGGPKDLKDCPNVCNKSEFFGLPNKLNLMEYASLLNTKEIRKRNNLNNFIPVFCPLKLMESKAVPGAPQPAAPRPAAAITATYLHQTERSHNVLIGAKQAKTMKSLHSYLNYSDCSRLNAWDSVNPNDDATQRQDQKDSKAFEYHNATGFFNLQKVDNLLKNVIFTTTKKTLEDRTILEIRFFICLDIEYFMDEIASLNFDKWMPDPNVNQQNQHASDCIYDLNNILNQKNEIINKIKSNITSIRNEFITWLQDDSALIGYTFDQSEFNDKNNIIITKSDGSIMKDEEVFPVEPTDSRINLYNWFNSIKYNNVGTDPQNPTIKDYKNLFNKDLFVDNFDFNDFIPIKSNGIPFWYSGNLGGDSDGGYAKNNNLDLLTVLLIKCSPIYYTVYIDLKDKEEKGRKILNTYSNICINKEFGIDYEKSKFSNEELTQDELETFSSNQTNSNINENLNSWYFTGYKSEYYGLKLKRRNQKIHLDRNIIFGLNLQEDELLGNLINDTTTETDLVYNMVSKYYKTFNLDFGPVFLNSIKKKNFTKTRAKKTLLKEYFFRKRNYKSFIKYIDANFKFYDEGSKTGGTYNPLSKFNDDAYLKNEFSTIFNKETLNLSELVQTKTRTFEYDDIPNSTNPSDEFYIALYLFSKNSYYQATIEDFKNWLLSDSNEFSFKNKDIYDKIHSGRENEAKFISTSNTFDYNEINNLDLSKDGINLNSQNNNPVSTLDDNIITNVLTDAVFKQDKHNNEKLLPYHHTINFDINNNINNFYDDLHSQNEEGNSNLYNGYKSVNQDCNCDNEDYDIYKKIPMKYTSSTNIISSNITPITNYEIQSPGPPSFNNFPKQFLIDINDNETKYTNDVINLIDFRTKINNDNYEYYYNSEKNNYSIIISFKCGNSVESITKCNIDSLGSDDDYPNYRFGTVTYKNNPSNIVDFSNLSKIEPNFPNNTSLKITLKKYISNQNTNLRLKITFNNINNLSEDNIKTYIRNQKSWNLNDNIEINIEHINIENNKSVVYLNLNNILKINLINNFKNTDNSFKNLGENGVENIEFTNNYRDLNECKKICSNLYGDNCIGFFRNEVEKSCDFINNKQQITPDNYPNTREFDMYIKKYLLTDSTMQDKKNIINKYNNPKCESYYTQYNKIYEKDVPGDCYKNRNIDKDGKACFNAANMYFKLYSDVFDICSQQNITTNLWREKYYKLLLNYLPSLQRSDSQETFMTGYELGDNNIEFNLRLFDENIGDDGEDIYIYVEGANIYTDNIEVDKSKIGHIFTLKNDLNNDINQSNRGDGMRFMDMDEDNIYFENINKNITEKLTNDYFSDSNFINDYIIIQSNNQKYIKIDDEFINLDNPSPTSQPTSDEQTILNCIENINFKNKYNYNSQSQISIIKKDNLTNKILNLNEQSNSNSSILTSLRDKNYYRIIITTTGITSNYIFYELYNTRGELINIDYLIINSNSKYEGYFYLPKSQDKKRIEDYKIIFLNSELQQISISDDKIQNNIINNDDKDNLINNVKNLLNNLTDFQNLEEIVMNPSIISYNYIYNLLKIENDINNAVQELGDTADSEVNQIRYISELPELQENLMKYSDFDNSDDIFRNFLLVNWCYKNNNKKRLNNYIKNLTFSKQTLDLDGNVSDNDKKIINFILYNPISSEGFENYTIQKNNIDLVETLLKALVIYFLIYLFVKLLKKIFK
jgi:hypothetical protein